MSLCLLCCSDLFADEFALCRASLLAAAAFDCDRSCLPEVAAAEVGAAFSATALRDEGNTALSSGIRV
jgi:hypothetical protein